MPTQSTWRHRAAEFRQFLAQIDRTTPPELALHLIVDNSATHTTEAIREFLAAHSRSPAAAASCGACTLFFCAYQTSFHASSPHPGRVGFAVPR